ncbi:MAG TPA: hypothetical protein VKG84_11840 [Candidatus Acidoferrales bacterium]|nr:hypothetical protein [Candidatus Acidoferrales bacterium]
MKLRTLSRPRLLHCLLLAATAAAVAGASCQRFEYVSMRPLEEAGFRYSSIQQLEQLELTKAEVAELVKAAKGGVGEATCVLLIHVARGQKTRFADGDAAAALHAAGIADPAIVELAQLRQLGPWEGEAQAIRLTGTSDRVIVAIARRRAAGQPAPSGASLARMKDAGVSEATIIELINRGITDTDAASVEWRKKRGWKDEQILRDFPAKP